MTFVVACGLGCSDEYCFLTGCYIYFTTVYFGFGDTGLLDLSLFVAMSRMIEDWELFTFAFGCYWTMYIWLCCVTIALSVYHAFLVGCPEDTGRETFLLARA